MTSPDDVMARNWRQTREPIKIKLRKNVKSTPAALLKANPADGLTARVDLCSAEPELIQVKGNNVPGISVREQNILLLMILIYGHGFNSHPP
jgi:hypothetical protein